MALRNALLLFLLGPGLAAPVAAAPLPVVTLDEALAYARAHQPQIKSALAELTARRADARVPRAQWLPQLGATAQLFVATANNTTASYLGTPEVDLPRIGGSPSRTQATASWSPAASSLAAIGASQEVYDFGRISAQIAVADAQAALAAAREQAVELDVQLGVAEAYDAVLAARDVQAATEDAYKRALTHRDYAQAGTRSGMRPPVDLTRAQADVAQLEVRRIRVAAGLTAARAGLAAAMGSDAPQVDAQAAPLDAAPGPALPDAVQRALAANPAVVAALAELGARESAVRAVARELLPNLAATATLSARAGGADASGNPTPPTPYGDGWLPDVANWHVGLVLQWNLFDATVLARRAAAKARVEGARADVELARTNVRLAAERASLDLDAALQVLPGLRIAVDAAKANQAQADARFRAGLGTILELADAEALLTNAQLEQAVGQFTVARSRAALGRVMGQALGTR